MGIEDLQLVVPPPTLGADALGLPPAPTAPTLQPLPGPASQEGRQKALAIASAIAALAGGRDLYGLPAGVIQGQQRMDQQRQVEAGRIQQENQRQQALFAQQSQLYATEQQRRQQTLLGAIDSIKKQVTTIPSKDQYDQQVEGFANMLQQSGYRVTANQVRTWAPFTVPSAEKKAAATLAEWLKNPNNETLWKMDPQRAAVSMVPFDRDGDGIPEDVPIRELAALAGQPFGKNPISGEPEFAKADTPLALRADANGILQQLVEQDKAEGKRASPERLVQLQEQAITRAQKATSAGRPPARPPAGSATDVDAQGIADAIIAGDQPPTLQGLYRYGAAVRSDLAKRGYDLASAQTDWAAVQQHLRTLNGSQQTRLQQAMDNASHSLDVIEDLAAQWKGGKFPVLNRGRLAAAKNGVLGPHAQQIATQLEAQISDVTSELGNVYMGGNSPTDHALTLAAKNLSADWSEGQLRAALTLARTNLRIRANSIKNVGVSGIDQSRYAPTSTPQTPGETAPTEETWTRDPATGKMIRGGR